MLFEQDIISSPAEAPAFTEEAPSPAPTPPPATPDLAGNPAAGGEPPMTMEDVVSYEETLKEFRPGALLKGRVVRVDTDGVLVDVASKAEGTIPLQELSHRPGVDPKDLVAVGDEIDVVVLRHDKEGNLLLSKKRADLESAWQTITKAFQNGEVVTGPVVEQVKGGLIVDLGLRGFVPASQVDARPVKDLSDFVGEAFRMKVVEVDRNRRKVVLSRKKVLDEERAAQRTQTFENLYEGNVVEGTVVRLTSFGAFVNLGGLDGLVHISELSYRRVNSPADVVTVGDKVEVLVLKVDKKKDRISLSLRQAKPDPWSGVPDQFKDGQSVSGKVTKFAKNYVFVELADGVEGVIPLSEMADRRAKPEEVLTIGQELTVRILEVRAGERRILLSLRPPGSEPDRGSSSAGAGDKHSGFTLGAMLRQKIEEGAMSADSLLGTPASPSQDSPEPTA